MKHESRCQKDPIKKIKRNIFEEVTIIMLCISQRRINANVLYLFICFICTYHNGGDCNSLILTTKN